MTFQRGGWFVIDFSAVRRQSWPVWDRHPVTALVRSSLMIVSVWDQRDNLICRFGAELKSSGYCSLMKIILLHMPAESTVTAASRNFCFAALKPVDTGSLLQQRSRLSLRHCRMRLMFLICIWCIYRILHKRGCALGEGGLLDSLLFWSWQRQQP